MHVFDPTPFTAGYRCHYVTYDCHSPQCNLVCSLRRGVVGVIFMFGQQAHSHLVARALRNHPEVTAGRIRPWATAWRDQPEAAAWLGSAPEVGKQLQTALEIASGTITYMCVCMCSGSLSGLRTWRSTGHAATTAKRRRRARA